MKNSQNCYLSAVLACAVFLSACDGVGQAPKVETVAATASAQSGQTDTAEQLYQRGAEARRKGDYDQAISLLERAVALQPKDPMFNHDLGLTYSYKPDMQDKARQAYLRAIEVAPEPKAHSPAVPKSYYNLACVEALQGNTVKALDYLEAAVAMGFSDLGYLQNDNELDSLRKEQRFILLLRNATAKFSASQ